MSRGTWRGCVTSPWLCVAQHHLEESIPCTVGHPGHLTEDCHLLPCSDMASKYNIKYFYDITDRSNFRANPDYKGVCHVALAQVSPAGRRLTGQARTEL